jgi:hypothetical protein
LAVLVEGESPANTPAYKLANAITNPSLEG